MSLFLQSAEAWRSLMDISYQVLIGRKGKSKCIELCFCQAEFGHLAGIHYANDVDFKLHRNEYQGGKLISALRSGKLDGSLIEKSQSWPRISERLKIICRLEDILESEFKLYSFSPHKLPFYSTIEAEYLLYSEELEKAVFLFLDAESGVYYCRSVFEGAEADYRRNQTIWTVLKKEKFYNGQKSIIFRHPGYKEAKGQIL